MKKKNVYTKNTVEKKKKIKMDRIDTEKIMMSEHGGLPRCNKTTGTSIPACYGICCILTQVKTGT